jgi:hypothetical protein
MPWRWNATSPAPLGEVIRVAITFPEADHSWATARLGVDAARARTEVNVQGSRPTGSHADREGFVPPGRAGRSEHLAPARMASHLPGLPNFWAISSSIG